MRSLRLILGAFGLCGLVFLAAGVSTFLQTRRFLATAVSASGVVTENVWREDQSASGRTSWGFYPRIRFQTIDGQVITLIADSGSKPPAYRVDEPVTVLYEPRQPYHAVIRSFAELWMPSLLFSTLGLVFCSICAGPVVWKLLSARKSAWLRRNGRRITAEITHVGLDKSLSVNGQHPYRISCQWLDPAANQLHVFRSGSIWFNPRSHLHGNTVDVLIDPSNPHRYVVLTDFLPQVV